MTKRISITVSLSEEQYGEYTEAKQVKDFSNISAFMTGVRLIKMEANGK